MKECFVERACKGTGGLQGCWSGDSSGGWIEGRIRCREASLQPTFTVAFDKHGKPIFQRTHIYGNTACLIYLHIFGKLNVRK